MEKSKSRKIKCADLLVGQYRCQSPKIDNLTQEPQDCERRHSISHAVDTFIDTATGPINYYTAPKIKYEGGIYTETIDGYTFEKDTPCRWTNRKYYRSTVALSLFLGVFDIDRVYLGYYVNGLLKLFTYGFILADALVDFLLIALQILAFGCWFTVYNGLLWTSSIMD
jgi:TM2 domain-containing membrane protein YozV